MPTSKSSKFLDTRYAKWLVIVNAFVPLAVLVWDGYHHQLGVNEVNFAIKTTGLVGLTLLVLALLVTPLRRLTGWTMLISIRRNLGVIGFLYILTHFLIFFWWDRNGSIASTATEIVDREYLWYGFGALVIMTPLALTSTDAMVSRLGAKRWKLLHRLTYVAVAAGGYHYYLQAKSDKRQPDAYLIAIGLLLAYRFISKELDLRRDLRLAHAKLNATKTASPKKKAFWSGTLKLSRIFQETPDVKTFRFVNPDGGSLPFEHTAGQYINLKLTIDGKRVNRSYTIASSPTRSAYCEISVKRAANGYGSKHLHDTWQEGQLVQVSAPAGKFFFAGHEAEKIVLIAGGIGITPMMSVVRSLTDRGWAGQIYLVFSVRKQADIVFAHEIMDLQERHQNLHVLITLSNETDAAWTGARGQVTKELLAEFIPDFKHGPVMLCGPDPMMTAMRALVGSMGVPDAEIHQEAFISTPPIEMTPDMQEAEAALPDGVVPSLSFQKSGINAEQPAEQSILEVAEEAGVQISFECRSGICGQCKTRLVSGKVRMEVQDALTQQDRAKGLILACQAHATRDCVIDA
ncbi:MAG: ferric reductase-like transmembrane domain-containing protein [Deltaproteobacteria bacterium]